MASFTGFEYFQRTSGLRDIVSSDSFVISAWVKAEAGDGGVIFAGGVGTGISNIRVSFDMGAFLGAGIGIRVTDTAGTELWATVTDEDFRDGAVHHIGISADLSAGRGQVYVDGDAADLTTQTAVTAGTIAFAESTRWEVGIHTGGDEFVGSLYDLAFWPGVTLDLSDSDDLNLIVAIDEDQGLATDPRVPKPVGYGHRGAYLGAEAALLFNGAWEQNIGYGGLFTRTGVAGEDSAEASAPSGYRFFPRWRTPGERWFPSEQSGDPYPRSQTFIEHREGLISFGKRLGLDEMDAPTRRERPGFNFTDIVLGLDEEDDEEDRLR